MSVERASSDVNLPLSSNEKTRGLVKSVFSKLVTLVTNFFRALFCQKTISKPMTERKVTSETLNQKTSKTNKELSKALQSNETTEEMIEIEHHHEVGPITKSEHIPPPGVDPTLYNIYIGLDLSKKDLNFPTPVIKETKNSDAVSFIKNNTNANLKKKTAPTLAEINKLKCLKYSTLLGCFDSPCEDFTDKIFNGIRSSLKISKEATSSESVLYKNSKKAYLKIVKDLGTLVSLAQKRKLSSLKASYVYEQCYNLYTKVNLHSANLEFLKFFERDKELNSSPASSSFYTQIKHQLNTTYNHIESDSSGATNTIVHRTGTGAVAKFGIDYYPLLGDPPEIKGTLHIGKRQINLLTFGSPTIQEKALSNLFITAPAKLEPVFEGFLQHLEKINGKILYISLQDITDRSKGDYSRSYTIIEAQKNTLHVIVLPQNSPFYYGLHADGTPLNWLRKNFKSKMVESYFSKKAFPQSTGIYLPDAIKDLKGFKEKFEKSLDWIIKILEIDKYSAGILTPPDFKFANGLIYTFIPLILAANEELGLTHLNFSCREAVDRAAKELSEFFADLMELNETETFLRIEKLKETFLSRGYWVGKRVPESTRMKELLKALKRRERKSYKDFFKEAIRDVIGNNIILKFPNCSS